MADEHFFRFERGRFLVDNDANLAKRYVSFDVAALGRIAANAVGAASCIKTEKHHEGTHNKILLLTLSGGTQVIAKIPQPNAGFTERTVASEVATMEFVRDVLETPVPKVHAWSASTDNEVGAAYIIMEKCSGTRLTTMWPEMDVSQRAQALLSLAVIQARWASITFTKYGSLYYAADVDAQYSGGALYMDKDGQSIENAKYVIGPCTSQLHFRDSRGTVDFYRGPWDNAEAYVEGLCKQEIACVQHAAKFPKPPVMLYGPGTYIPTKEKKLRALNYHMKLAKHLLPDASLSGAVLWHPWIEGVFIDLNSPGSPMNITGILGWQGAELAPLFMTVLLADMTPYEGTDIPGSEAPALPDFIATHGQEAHDMGQGFFRNMVRDMVSGGYRLALGHGSSRPVMRAVEFQSSQAYTVLLMGSTLFNYGEAVYSHIALSLRENWTTLVPSGVPFPLVFTEQDERDIAADLNNCRLATEAMQRVQRLMSDIKYAQMLNFMVPPNQYARAKSLMRSLKQLWMQQLEVEGLVRSNEQRLEAATWWPFDD